LIASLDVTVAYTNGALSSKRIGFIDCEPDG
jgi:hypothetical protein